MICLHDRLVRKLVNELEDKHWFDRINYFMEYKRNKFSGEVDVLAYKREENMYYFFEVKCSYEHDKIRKARKQYYRFKKAFPELKTRGILYTPRKIRRIR